MNEQGMTYGTGTYFHLKDKYPIDQIEIHIGQPRLDHWDSRTANKTEIDNFIAWVKSSVKEALGDNPKFLPTKEGCRFCPKKPGCEHYEKQKLTFSKKRIKAEDDFADSYVLFSL